MSVPDKVQGVIDARRDRVDELDARIVELLQLRVKVSEEIQRERMNSGGTRSDLFRESVVLRRYQDAFPEAGTALGTEVLRLCRSKTPHPKLQHIPKDR
ncbi:chorismate mutase [Streptomyces sp. MUM 178J]|uniref:chorismate mutase n=1 Tax=Streptomyces sp. MUM 178J TaxID=2791991 RepID=UPI001F04B6E1|nr:chorismate mutase [Streptomyces sp. MUM 178J]WRQ82650.1 chorismate mutase [Streptomyces sp. MUM 178J]